MTPFFRALGPCLVSCGLLVSAAPVSAQIASRPANDPALGALIEPLVRRDSIGLTVEKLAEGGEKVDLQGRYQQVTLAQLDSSGEVMVGCVGTMDEANRFFGRDLFTGAPVAKLAAEESIETIARRHGMSPAEYQFYSDLAGQAKSLMQAKASSILIVNNDTTAEGFNSTAPQILPAPGNNTNPNLGAQRLALFNAAAAVWSAFLDSTVTIRVRANFDSLTPCSNGGGVLGAAGSISIFRNFSNAGFTNTFYPGALANKQAGLDLDTVSPDIGARFNSDIDTGCLGAGTHFYYGLDNATPSQTVNLFVVVLHELGHGLGSASFANQDGTYAGATGTTPDIWARFMFDNTQNLSWFDMAASQRAASALNTGHLFWDGANVRNASGALTAGREAGTGRVELFAPNPYQNGSSVSHYGTAVTPSLLMEPIIVAGIALDLDLTRQQMRDIGWYRDANGDLAADTITNVQPSSGTLTIGAVRNITWTNTSGFTRNVTIELSTNGGTTYPTVIASNIANTGTFAWTVPNTPTTQARVRVREHDFLAPLGASSANFTIGANTAPTFAPAAALTRQQGNNPIQATVGTVSDTQSGAGALTVTQIAGGTATGIVVTNVVNSNGTVSAQVSATCTATAGTVRFQVSDGSLLGTGDLGVQVTANTPPTIGYTSQSVVGGGGATISTSSPITENGFIAAVAVQSTGTYTGGITVTANGVITLTNAAPVGTHTITIRATDNCNVSTDASFLLQVTNTAPSFTAGTAVTRQQGSAGGAAVTLGTVNDAQTPRGNLTVTQIAGGTATGITASNFLNTNGTITAVLAANCSAVAGTVRFQVSDGNMTGVGDLTVNVTANTPPNLGAYVGDELALGGGATFLPSIAPSDNGTVDTLEASLTPAGFTGTASTTLATGGVTLANAGPLGEYTLNVVATDNCGATRTATAPVSVSNEPIFNDGFE